MPDKIDLGRRDLPGAQLIESDPNALARLVDSLDRHETKVDVKMIRILAFVILGPNDETGVGNDAPRQRIHRWWTFDRPIPGVLIRPQSMQQDKRRSTLPALRSR